VNKGFAKVVRLGAGDSPTSAGVVDEIAIAVDGFRCRIVALRLVVHVLVTGEAPQALEVARNRHLAAA
jgi:hypothetical protein